ncbi:hypothetical protein, partial [Vibrio parahaemolyticus]|uniref:hypothetical protein n=1 Tax=Vibrio parahaemolyticus TaxID=670 RepID=UPI001A90777D
ESPPEAIICLREHQRIWKDKYTAQLLGTQNDMPAIRVTFSIIFISYPYKVGKESPAPIQVVQE